MATQLTSESTHEDIQTAVDQIIESRQGDTQQQQKTDGKAIAEDHEPVITTKSAETDSGGDDTAHEGEETGASDDQSSWIDDNVKAEVAAYGLNEELLKEFSSREELDRAVRMFDLHALEVGRKAMAEGETGDQPRDEHGRFTKPESKQEAAANESKEGQYEIGLSKDVYDEELIGEFARLRDHYESRLSNMESRFAEIEARAEEELFDSIVDSLGHADLFGKTGKETQKELERRQDLHVAVKAQQIGLQMLGRETSLDNSLVNRVARMVFAEELGKKELKARTKKVAEQSSGVFKGASAKTPDPEESLKDWANRRYKELEGAK